MSADKRTVSTDALETLGMIHTREEKRDAIHLAVIPAEAGEYLAPGWHVALRDGKAHVCDIGQGLGVVDPFLQRAANKGERFWLVIYPRVITSLRHVWTHPSIEDEAAVGTISPTYSEQWLRNWCDHSEIDYDDLIEVSKTGEAGSGDDYNEHRWTLGGGILTSHGYDASGEIPPEVWVHVTNVIGRRPVSTSDWFNCSC